MLRSEHLDGVQVIEHAQQGQPNVPVGATLPRAWVTHADMKRSAGALAVQGCLKRREGWGAADEPGRDARRVSNGQAVAASILPALPRTQVVVGIVCVVTGKLLTNKQRLESGHLCRAGRVRLGAYVVPEHVLLPTRLAVGVVGQALQVHVLELQNLGQRVVPGTKGDVCGANDVEEHVAFGSTELVHAVKAFLQDPEERNTSVLEQRELCHNDGRSCGVIVPLRNSA
mmetsp:Transcript_66281/g.163276  ORF Transcript_66281/g.163276 Transcript_66281/m.163276 type:complete len:228 (+) Transcript_66281:1229-1912(+)